MFSDMKQFLSSDVCLSCEGCCRFDKKASDWRPKVGTSEVDTLKRNYASDGLVGAQSLVDKGGYLSDKLCHGMYACTFFNPEDTTCGIYHHRPFECRLYPFVLTRREQKPAVCVHLTCPYIQENKGSEKYFKYVEYLKGLFQTEEVRLLLNHNPHLFGAYKGYEAELEWVFDVGLS